MRSSVAILSDITERELQGLDFTQHPSASHVYLAVLNRAFEQGVGVEKLHLSDIIDRLNERAVVINSKLGLFELDERSPQATAVA